MELQELATAETLGTRNYRNWGLQELKQFQDLQELGARNCKHNMNSELQELGIKS